MVRVTPGRRRSVLHWAFAATCIAWSCGAASGVLVWIQARTYVFHPPYQPLTTLFAGIALATIAGVACSLWHAILGPRRWRAAAIFAAALLPAGLWSYVGAAAKANWSERYAPNNFTMRAAKVMGATFMRLEAESTYRQRMESGRIVMYYDRSRSEHVERVDRPKEDLAAMDRHLARLEDVLGARVTDRIHWIRGPLLGREYLSLHGLVLGSAWSPELSDDLAGGYRGDRHELAHAALDWFRTPESDPPYVLHEGWAMAQCGDTRLQLAQAAAKAKLENPDLSVRHLFEPTWYHRDAGPVYEFGGAYVDFLIRTFDGRRFRKYYVECTPDAYDSKCREVFQTEFDDLETSFWRDVDDCLRKGE